MILSSNSLQTLPGDLVTSREFRGEVVGASQGSWECLEVRINNLCFAYDNKYKKIRNLYCNTKNNIPRGNCI